MPPKAMKTKASLKAVEGSNDSKMFTNGNNLQYTTSDQNFMDVEITPAEKVKLGRRGKGRVNYNENSKAKLQTKSDAIEDSENVDTPVAAKKAKGKRGKPSNSQKGSDLKEADCNPLETEDKEEKRGRKKNTAASSIDKKKVEKKDGKKKIVADTLKDNLAEGKNKKTSNFEPPGEEKNQASGDELDDNSVKQKHRKKKVKSKKQLEKTVGEVVENMEVEINVQAEEKVSEKKKKGNKNVIKPVLESEDDEDMHNLDVNNGKEVNAVCSFEGSEIDVNEAINSKIKAKGHKKTAKKEETEKKKLAKQHEKKVKKGKAKITEPEEKEIQMDHVGSNEEPGNQSAEGQKSTKNLEIIFEDYIGFGRKRAANKIQNYEDKDESDDERDEPVKKRGKTKSSKEPKAAPAKNKTVTAYEDIDFSNDSKDKEGNSWNMKISSWNVDGIRAWLGKGGMDFIKYEKPDILCLQEVKCAKDKLPEEIASVPGYHPYWCCSEKDGYAGVAVYSKKMAINVQQGLGDPELDDEGRIITAEFKNFYLICTYVPNAGRKLVTLPKRLKWNEEFRKHVKQLESKKRVIICGDMNVAHNEIDLANPKTNKKNAGFTEEERTGMTDLLSDGFVDTFRQLYPDKKDAYTFWTYMMNSRAKNVGWRLDYFIVSEALLPSVCDVVIRDEVYGSDHCPITLFIHFKNLAKVPTDDEF